MNKFKFDPHTHTSECSHCGILTAVELVDAYHAAGYNGIAITDHLCQHYCAGFDTWADAVEDRLGGYKAAKKRGDEIGLNVILGIELRFNESWSDFLLYGIDEAFLLANPHPYRQSLPQFFECHGNDILIIQAHPFRDNPPQKLFPKSVHGIEVFNGNLRHNNNDKLVFDLLKKHPNYYTINGSDAHEPEDVGGQWINLNHPVKSSYEFRDIILSREYSLGREPK